MASTLDLAQAAATPTSTTTYHIYNTGTAQDNLVLYTTPDRMLPSLCPNAEVIDRSRPNFRRWSWLGQPQRDVVYLDDPKTDPRAPAYFLHTPKLCGHMPPQTLRVGGRQGCVVCLVDCSLFWRRWSLKFVVPEKERKGFLGRMWRPKSSRSLREGKEDGGTEACRVDSGFGAESDRTSFGGHMLRDGAGEYRSLNAPGGIDPRGVVSSKYPVRSFSFPGESGREYVRQQKQLRKSVSCSDMTSDAPSALELPAHLTPSVPSLELSWNGWLTREYGFDYGGIEFRWKGTRTVADERKYWGKWSMYNHLKLVAYLPLGDGKSEEEGENESEDTVREDEDTGEPVATEKERPSTPIPGKRTLVLAKYISLMAYRKAGRLTVFENGLGECFSDEEERERLRHILVATATCMIRGEKEKRKTVRDIVISALTEGSG